MKISVTPKKSLGQHFLHDKNIAAKIASSIPSDTIPMLEIGPGMGMLTQFLLQRPNPLKLVEIDAESVAYLTTHFPQLQPEQLIHADFLKLDPTSFFTGPYAIVGNFPYNISSQILFKLVENPSQIPMLCGMFQKEVALRIAAAHGNKQYGILSVLLQTWYDVKVLFSVSEQAFIPPPNVQSAVILVTSKPEQPQISKPKLFKDMVKVIFNQRRKMLKTPLRHRFGQHLVVPYENLRPEQLSVSDFLILYHELERQGCC